MMNCAAVLLLLLGVEGLPATLPFETPVAGFDPIYNCTYSDLSPVRTVLHVLGKQVKCGDYNGLSDWKSAFNPKDLGQPPNVTLIGADTEAYYAVFLINPFPKDFPFASYVNPILHHAVGNVRGEDLISGDLSNATTIAKYHPPNPPVPGFNARFSYLVFKQNGGGKEDYSDVQKLCSAESATSKFPIEGVAKNKRLELIQSNFFLVRLWS